jgi:hypothetical protein
MRPNPHITRTKWTGDMAEEVDPWQDSKMVTRGRKLKASFLK